MLTPDKIYESTEQRTWAYKLAMNGAERMLEKAKIAANIQVAHILAKTIKSKPTSETDEYHELYSALLNCHEHITDEIAIISAFEHFAKSKLLREQYIIHEFESGEENTPQKEFLKNQKKRPCDIATYLTQKKTSDIKLKKDRTISASTLLKPAYSEKYGLSKQYIDYLKKCNSIRNEIHLISTPSYNVNLETTSAIKELKLAIEKHLQSTS